MLSSPNKALLQAAVVVSVPAQQLFLENIEFTFQYLEDIETTLLFHSLLFFELEEGNTEFE